MVWGLFRIKASIKDIELHGFGNSFKANINDINDFVYLLFHFEYFSIKNQSNNEILSSRLDPYEI